MPSNDKNKGFAIPGALGKRLAYASDVGVLVRPTREAIAHIQAHFKETPQFERALDFLVDVPEEGKRARCGRFAFSERTHSIIERERHLGAHSFMIAPAIVATPGRKLVEISVGWVEYDLLVRYSGSEELKESRGPDVDTWSFIAEKCVAPRDSVKLAFFSAIYGISSRADVSLTWDMIAVRFPELGVLREELKAFGPGYIQRRSNDWRSDLYEQVLDVVDFPVVLAGSGSRGLYLEVPLESVDSVVSTIEGVDRRIEVRSSTTLAEFYGVYQLA